MMLAAALQAQPVKLPVYGARHTVDEIRIDGKLDEASWALSPHVGEIRLIQIRRGGRSSPQKRLSSGTMPTSMWLSPVLTASPGVA